MTPKTEMFFSTPVKRGDSGKEFRISATSVSRGEALALYDLVKQSAGPDAMEIGLAIGGSAVAIAEALDHKGGDGLLVTLDPFQPTVFQNVGLKELERLDLSHRVKFLPAHAEYFLCESSKAGRRFDFIFIDACHPIGNKMTSTFFADRCLSPGGILAFHDAFMLSTMACVEYLVRERGYEPIRLRPDSSFKRWARTIKHAVGRGRWYYAYRIAPCTHRSLVALLKTHCRKIGQDALSAREWS